MSKNDRFRNRVWDSMLNKYLHENEYYISSWGGIGFFNHEGRGEFDPNRYIKQQSTGLKDMNGKLIFQGDRVEATFTKRTIEFKDGGFGWQAISHDGFVKINQEMASRFRIIGNIYEHKHL